MRRPLLLALILWLPVFAATAAEPPSILVVGDSLSAGYGLGVGHGWVSLLAQRLGEQGYPHRVVNASISGDTSAGGLARLPAALERQRPAIVIIELGANDGLRGLPLNTMRDNLNAMVKRARQRGAKVLLIGMRLPPNYGPAYTDGFQAIYADIAARQGAALVPFLLDGVALRPELMQADQLHPNGDAQALLLDNVWPKLLPLLGAPTTARTP